MRKDSRSKKPFLDTSRSNLSNDILDIHDKPDVAVWNKAVRTHEDKRELKIGSLDQNLIREGENALIDPASKESVAEAIISGAQLTDRVDLSKLDRKNKK